MSYMTEQAERIAALESQVRECEKHNEILKQSELRLLKEVRDLTGEREQSRKHYLALLDVLWPKDRGFIPISGEYILTQAAPQLRKDADEANGLRDNVEGLERDKKSLAIQLDGQKQVVQTLHGEIHKARTRAAELQGRINNRAEWDHSG